MERLWQHFNHANKAATAHSQAAWQYPLHLANRLHEKMNEEPGRSTMDIIIHKFKYLKQSTDLEEFVPANDPDVPIDTRSKLSIILGLPPHSVHQPYHSCC